MADKGVINNRKGSVTFSVEIDGQKKDIVIKPGANRLSEAQHAALSKHPLFGPLFSPTDRVETISVPDPEKPGEMKTQTIRKKQPAKFTRSAVDDLDPEVTKVHEGAGLEEAKAAPGKK